MKKKYVYLGLSVLWMICIFYFSSQVGDDSQSLSDGVLGWFLNLFHSSIFQPNTPLYEFSSFLLRKAAHMSEYALLAILLSLYFRSIEKRHAWLYAIILVFMYAMSDEFHQLFVPGRSGQFIDVCIDTFGGCVGLVLQQLYFIIIKRFIKNKQA